LQLAGRRWSAASRRPTICFRRAEGRGKLNSVSVTHLNGIPYIGINVKTTENSVFNTFNTIESVERGEFAMLRMVRKRLMITMRLAV